MQGPLYVKRPLLVFCLLTVACIRIGCGLGLLPRAGNQVSKAEQFLSTQDTLLLQGQVCERSEESFYLKSIIILQTATEQSSIKLPTNMKLICKLNGKQYSEEYQQVKMGSTVLVSGDFATFSKASNPGQFDARAYYGGQNICGNLWDCEVQAISMEYNLLQESLYRLRQKWSERIYELMPQREASVLNTILLGEREQMDQETKELYKAGGILHIASISGLHVMLIAMGIYKLLRKCYCPVIPACVLSSVILVLYGMMTGMSTSAIRAIAMFLLRMLAQIVGRTYDMLTALGLVGAVMATVHPDYLWDAGFLLSFGAVMGMGLLAPALKATSEKRRVIRKVPPKHLELILKHLGKELTGLRDSFYTCLAVNLAILPIQLWFYYEVPVFSLLLNLLIIPSVSILAVLGFLLMLVPALGWLAPLPEQILVLYRQLCLFWQSWPAHTWTPGRPEVWQIVVYYGVLVVVVLMRSGNCNLRPDSGLHRSNRRRIGKFGRSVFGGEKKCRFPGPGVLAWCSILLGVCILGIPLPRDSSVTFLDVGQGDCICVETASGEVYVFDCGSSSESKVGQYILMPYLKYHGIREIDGLFISHGDKDHCIGALELLENGDEWGIEVRQLILPEIEETQRSEKLDELLTAAGHFVPTDSKDINLAYGQEKLNTEWVSDTIPVSFVSAGDYVENNDLKLLCLHPREDSSYIESNQYSQCFYIQLGESGEELRLLLTGDVEGLGEQELIEQLKKHKIEEIDVLKVAHHGSRYSTSEEVLEQITPRVAVISCGEENSYGHPHREVLERLGDIGGEIFVTADRGAVTIDVKRRISVYERTKGEDNYH